MARPFGDYNQEEGRTMFDIDRFTFNQACDLKEEALSMVFDLLDAGMIELVD
jgi:hypothetical protein